MAHLFVTTQCLASQSRHFWSVFKVKHPVQISRSDNKYEKRINLYVAIVTQKSKKKLPNHQNLYKSTKSNWQDASAPEAPLESSVENGTKLCHRLHCIEIKE